MIVRLECLKGQPCKGIGDRIKSLQSAFWMVRRGCDHPGARHAALPLNRVPHLCPVPLHTCKTECA